MLLHFAPSRRFRKSYPAQKILQGDPFDATDDGHYFKEEGNIWWQAAQSHPMTFNCCTFAIGDVAGLTPLDWVRPNASNETNNLNPMEIMLTSYFDLVSCYNSIDKAKFDEKIQKDDVVCFVKTDPQLEFVHAGRIHQHACGENWMISKFGDSDILVTPLNASARVWPDFNEVRIYRAKMSGH